MHYNEKQKPFSRHFILTPRTYGSCMKTYLFLLFCHAQYRRIYIREDIQEYYEKIVYSFGVAGGLGGAPLFRDGKVIGLHLATFGRNMKDGVSARTMLQVPREWLGVGEVS